MNFFRRSLFLPLALVSGLLVAACLSSGPQKSLDTLAEALTRNDSAAFLAQVDMKSFAANHIRNMTRDDHALGALDSMGRMLGLGGMEDLLGGVVDMRARLQAQFMRGVSTGELMAQCSAAETPDCPWVPDSLKKARITELGPDAAVAQVTTPARMTSWLALRKTGDAWLVVGQAVMESTAREYALPQAAPTKAAPAPVQPFPAPENPPMPENRADNQRATKI